MKPLCTWRGLQEVLARRGMAGCVWTATTDTLERRWIENVKRFQIVPFDGGRCNVFHKTFELFRSRRPPLTGCVGLHRASSRLRTTLLGCAKGVLRRTAAWNLYADSEINAGVGSTGLSPARGNAGYKWAPSVLVLSPPTAVGFGGIPHHVASPDR